MDSEKKVDESGFPARFRTFLDYYKLNTNRLAVQMQDSNPVKFRRWLSGEAKPNTTSLRAIADHYGVRADWFLFGEGPMLRDEHATGQAAASGRVAPAGVDLISLQIENGTLKAENSQLREMVATLTRTVTELQEEIRGYARDFRKLAFPVTSSFSPASPLFLEEERVVIEGFGRYQGKSRFHPATASVLRPLNSAAYRSKNIA